MNKVSTWKRKMAVAALAMVMMLGLCACGEASPEQVIKKAQESMASVSSMSYDMTMDMDMTYAGTTTAVSTKAAVDYVVNPLAMKMDASMDMGAQGSMDYTMYMTQEDNAYVTYMQMSGDSTWYKQEVAGADALTQYNAQETMDLYLASGESFKKSGTESISGETATRYDGIISKDAMSKVIDSTGVLAQLNMDGMDLTSVLANLDDMPISIWVNAKTGMPVQYKMDMTAMMQKLIDSIMAGVDSTGLTIDSVVVSMTVKSVNNVSSIDIPEEALSAQSI